ncbi:MAG: hypothetical protein V4621_07645 [Pseudomonadota bacterium]
MNEQKLLELKSYNPAALIDEVTDLLDLKNDRALAAALNIGAPSICKIRSKVAAITPNILIRMHDLTGKSLDELRAMGGIPKTNFDPGTTKKDSAHVGGEHAISDIAASVAEEQAMNDDFQEVQA